MAVSRCANNSSSTPEASMSRASSRALAKAGATGTSVAVVAMAAVANVISSFFIVANLFRFRSLTHGVWAMAHNRRHAIVNMHFRPGARNRVPPPVPVHAGVGRARGLDDAHRGHHGHALRR